MVKKVKRFLIWALFSFLYVSKHAEAARVCLVPKSDVDDFFSDIMVPTKVFLRRT